MIQFPAGFNLSSLVSDYALASAPFVTVACLLTGAFIILKSMK